MRGCCGDGLSVSTASIDSVYAHHGSGVVYDVLLPRPVLSTYGNYSILSPQQNQYKLREPEPETPRELWA